VVRCVVCDEQVDLQGFCVEHSCLVDCEQHDRCLERIRNSTLGFQIVTRDEQIDSRKFRTEHTPLLA
jgi:hypothetical protein